VKELKSQTSIKPQTNFGVHNTGEFRDLPHHKLNGIQWKRPISRKWMPHYTSQNPATVHRGLQIGRCQSVSCV